MLKGGETNYTGDARCLSCNKIFKHHPNHQTCPHCGWGVSEPFDLNAEPSPVLGAEPMSAEQLEDFRRQWNAVASKTISPARTAARAAQAKVGKVQA